MTKTKYRSTKQYTPEQKEAWKKERLAEQQSLLESAVAELIDSESWQTWVRFGRNNLRKYSFNNALLIWSQKRDAFNVAGKVQWSKKGVTVNPDTPPIHILAPQMINARDKEGNIMYDANGKPLKKVGFYRVVKVYDVSDTDAPKSDFTPAVTLKGDEFASHVNPLTGFARELGIVVRYDDIDTDGWYDKQRSEIVINKALEANAIVRTLIHELAHAYGNVNYKDYSREDAEVLVESATVMALGMVGFDVSTTSVPYIASWGADLEVLKKNALLVESMVNEFVDRMSI